MSNEPLRPSLERVIAFFRKHPERARSADKPATAVLEDGLRCRITGPGGAEVVSDMPRALGAGASAPTPGWYLRAALASCDATAIAIRAAREGVELTLLEVTVESESDDRGMLGTDDSVPAGPLEVRTQVRIGAAGIAPERLQGIVERAERHSPVADALRRPVVPHLEVEIVA